MSRLSLNTLFFSLSFCLIIGVSVNAQITYPKASFELVMKQTSGTNGSGITYDATKDLYYAVIAGNKVFPMEVFDGKGNNVFQTEAGNDMRGIWWNKKTKSIEGNCYNDGGIVSMRLDENGYPSLGNKSIFEGGHQPADNSVGVFDGKKYIYYYADGAVFVYSRKTGSLAKTMSMGLAPTPSKRDLNGTSMIYTGKKKMEIGLLDAVNKKIYLFNKKDGQQTAVITLPDSATTNSSFRFGYANGYAFIYGTSKRSWVGYRIFE